MMSGPSSTSCTINEAVTHYSPLATPWVLTSLSSVSGKKPSQCKLKAAVTFSNPVSIDSRHADAFHSPLIAAGMKFNGFLHHRHSLRPTLQQDPTWRAAWHKLWWKTWTLAGVDRTLRLVFPRNDPRDHGTAAVGYADCTDYWQDASSLRYMHKIRICSPIACDGIR